MIETTLTEPSLSLLTVAAVILIALISPGPDFVIIVKNSLMYSKKSAFYTAIGVSFGILVHLTYILFGFGLLFNKAGWVLTLIKYFGAAYLFYLGYNCIRSHKMKHSFSYERSVDIGSIKALTNGFLTATLNPKTLLFFASILTVMISPNTGNYQLYSYAGVIFLEALLWFSLVALLFTSNRVRKYFMKLGHWFETITGIILILIAIELFFR